jgi:hypothetical protein
MSEAALFSTAATDRANRTEDGFVGVVGLGGFSLALLSVAGVDALGRVATTAVRTDPTVALARVSKASGSPSGGASLVLTFVARLIVLGAGAAGLGEDVGRFAPVAVSRLFPSN